ncbi:lasso peptide biosynthesis B2 protein [Pseudonocardia broussonetiae]|uniref:Lasso peptide biosynthesis B2 protein n=1 Tax=Pseudonocardia broussonetiae TaxID=2736640 RepID=A0A6M6JK80_9PSEU|nr:lasso peptide biosynthesis B2 protein [Pseudonocardia broussonetiae]QJY47042.1 lasso peptide biosynthesis B2 protein [Pseudonocardia broussonetiae]
MTARRWALGAVEVLRALGPMVAVEVLLRTTDLPTTCRRLGVAHDLTAPAAPARATTDPISRAGPTAVLPRRTRRVVRACALVVAHWPAGDTCLRRCLLTGHRLRGLGPVLRIGVRRTGDGRFSAHSWLEVDGRPLDPAAGAFAALGAARP